MQPTSFPEQNVTFAEDQPEYTPLPAYKFNDHGDGQIVCCWQLSLKERLWVLFSGVVWQRILTFGKPLQPQLLSTVKPEMPPAVP